MTPLDTIADHQAQWSETATRLKSTLDRARRAVFLLSILGALAAALASQIVPPAEPVALAASPRTWVAIVGVACLAAATFFTARLLGAGQVTDWVRARAIAEALKREAYRFAAQAAPYDDPDRAKAALALEDERIRIEEDGADLIGRLTAASGPGSVPRTSLNRDDYVAERIDRQIAWFKTRAEAARKTAAALRRIEFALALAATLITAVASVTGKSAPVLGVTFDFAALTAVLTTVAGAVVAHVEASRYDFLVTTYLATARRLENRRNRARTPWSDFVNDCETILATESTSWIAKWSR